MNTQTQIAALRKRLHAPNVCAETQWVKKATLAELQRFAALCHVAHTRESQQGMPAPSEDDGQQPDYFSTYLQATELAELKAVIETWRRRSKCPVLEWNALEAAAQDELRFRAARKGTRLIDWATRAERQAVRELLNKARTLSDAGETPGWCGQEMKLVPLDFLSDEDLAALKTLLETCSARQAAAQPAEPCTAIVCHCLPHD